MKRLSNTRQAWAIKWVSDNSLDGHSEHFIGNGDRSIWLFHSRQRAREAVKEKYSYIAIREDLRREPFGWKVPRVVRVKVNVEECR